MRRSQTQKQVELMEFGPVYCFGTSLNELSLLNRKMLKCSCSHVYILNKGRIEPFKYRRDTRIIWRTALGNAALAVGHNMVDRVWIIPA
jgi:hypothetical protein